MEVTQIVEHFASLSDFAQESSLAGGIIGDRSINPLLTILQKLIDELNKPQSDQRRLSRLSIEAREHWGNIAQAALRDNEIGNVHKLELKLVIDSKALVDELSGKVDERIRNQGARRTDTSPPSVDSTRASEQDASMTDLNRQQVSDMLAASESKVDARLANFDTSVKTGFAELRAEFAGLRTEIANGRTDAAKQNHDSMKWIIGTIIAMVSISVAVIGLFINLSKSDKTPAAPATIVITVPGVTAAPAQAPAAK